MLSRAPLMLAAGLFLLGLTGFVGSVARSGRTVPFVGQRPPTATQPWVLTQALPVSDPAIPANILPTTAATVPPTAKPAVKAPEAPTPSAAPTATPEPRPPVVIAAVASDSTRQLQSSTPGPIRILMVGRDNADSPATPTATPSPKASPSPKPDPTAATTD